MIVVTTPTGQIGSAVLDGLAGGDEPVRVVVRDASRLGAEARRRVDVVEGSHDDVAVLLGALEGASALLWVVPPDPSSDDVAGTYLRFGRAAVQGVTAHSVPRVVVVSSLGREDEEAGLLSAAIAMDGVVRSSGAAVRVLRMPFYMENLLSQARRIGEEGVFSLTNAADRTLLLVSVRDVAAEAVRLLGDGSWTGQEDVPVVSADRLTPEGMASVMSEVLGLPVRFQPTGREDFAAMMTQRGASRAWARGMTDMSAAQDRGFYPTGPRDRAAGAPTTFRTWCAEVLAPALPSGGA